MAPAGKVERHGWIECKRQADLARSRTKPARQGVQTRDLSSLEHPLITPPNEASMAGNGGVGEGGRGKGEDGCGGRSTMKPVSSTKESANDGGDSQRGRVEAAGD